MKRSRLIGVPAWIVCVGGMVGLAGVTQAAVINIPIPGLGAISVQTNDDVTDGSNGDIKATFTHTKDSFAAAAEAACCGGHFNWLNIVRAMPTPGSVPNHPDTGMAVTSPWVDPLPGGTFGGGFNDPADKLPFYYDEKDGDPMTPGFQGIPLAPQISETNKTLMFFDRPENQPNTMWEFETYLTCVAGDIGQMDEMCFSVIAGFKWKFNESAADANSITNLMTLNLGDRTAINMDLNNIMDGYMMLQDWTVKNKVPAPGTMSLLAMAGLVAVRRRPAAAAA